MKKSSIQILPYSHIIGQDQLKLALELAFVAPRIGGVLISGQRGTGKSTAVRAFAQMMYDPHLDQDRPILVTLPINATEDRVVGGWKIDALMNSEAKRQPGLLEEAHGNLLYIDEVNLLDDHIVNIILDVASTGILVVQREGLRNETPVSFTLVGTMNPEEGGLRPQLLDRFGLMVNVKAEEDAAKRSKILQTVLAFDEAVFNLKHHQPAPFLDEADKDDEAHKVLLQQARERFYRVEVPEHIAQSCVTLATHFDAQGHRGDYVMALAARAYAALQGAAQVTHEHLKIVTPLALQHRRPDAFQSGQEQWSAEDDAAITALLNHA